MFCAPVVIKGPALLPMTTFSPAPVLIAEPALWPIRVFDTEEVIASPAFSPIAVLLFELQFAKAR